MQAVQSNESIQAQAVELAPSLARLVEEGSSKLAQRASGVSALLAACYIAAASHEADEVFRQQKVLLLALCQLLPVNAVACWVLKTVPSSKLFLV